MNYILNIHTTGERAIVNVSTEDQLLGSLINEAQKEHASFLHTAIKNLLQQHQIPVGDLSAIGVTGGPGSYTGIRVGLATAKGLCFALKIPMMMFNSLRLMAFAAVKNVSEADANSLFCPMIDARRMEVFTALFDKNLAEISPATSMVLNENSFDEIVKDKSLYYFGSGAEKFNSVTKHSSKNLHYLLSYISSASLAQYSWKKFQENDFENIINAHPLYVKEFYSPTNMG